jgi:hypothetical protein
VTVHEIVALDVRWQRPLGQLMCAAGWSEDTLLMPVPLQYVQAMADYLGELKSGRPASSSPAGEASESVIVYGQGGWNQPMVDKVAEATTYAGVLALIDRCAAKPGGWIAKEEIESELGISPIQLRNELGAFSKLTKRLFDYRNPIWPIEWRKERGVYRYRMEPLVAKWWTAARQTS